MSMITFREFRESEDRKSDLKASDVVRKGMNLQRGSDFWDDLVSLCGNTDGMAALLGVPKEVVTGLGGRVSKIKKQISSEDKGIKKNSKVIKTGDQI